MRLRDRAEDAGLAGPEDVVLLARRVEDEGGADFGGLREELSEVGRAAGVANEGEAARER